MPFGFIKGIFGGGSRKTYQTSSQAQDIRFSPTTNITNVVDTAGLGEGFAAFGEGFGQFGSELKTGLMSMPAPVVIVDTGNTARAELASNAITDLKEVVLKTAPFLALGVYLFFIRKK